MTSLIAARGLSKVFGASADRNVAVDDVDITIHAGESYGIVGESGSGKTTLIRCLLRLIQPTSGTIIFDGVDITRAKPTQLRSLRSRMGVVFQNPVLALNPRMTVEECVAEPLRVHTDLRGADLSRRITETLDSVGLTSAFQSRLPHQLSGGQCQRVGIARALATGPDLVVLDEPTSALDVSVQAQILNLLKDLRAERGLTYVMISHDLEVVRYLSDLVAVMLDGRIIETGKVDEVMDKPNHAYTRELVQAIPQIVSPQPGAGPIDNSEVESA